MRVLRAIIICVGALLVPMDVFASDILICHVGGIGNSEQAAPKVSAFIRHLEESAGLEKESLRGKYLNTKEECQAYVDENKPLLGVLDLATLLRNAKVWRLKPVAHVGPPDAKRFYVLVRPGTASNLDGLKGRVLASTELRDARFAARIIFGGSLDPVQFFKPEHLRRVLKGIRGVARGKYDAVLVDEAAFAHLGELDLPVALAEVFRSEPLPGLSLVVFGSPKKEQAPIVQRVLAALPRLCSGEGAKLCRAFEVKAFSKAKTADFNRLIERYHAK